MQESTAASMQAGRWGAWATGSRGANNAAVFAEGPFGAVTAVVSYQVCADGSKLTGGGVTLVELKAAEIIPGESHWALAHEGLVKWVGKVVESSGLPSLEDILRTVSKDLHDGAAALEVGTGFTGTNIRAKLEQCGGSGKVFVNCELI